MRRWCVGGASVALFGPYLCKSMLNLPFPHLSVINVSLKIPRQIHGLVCSLCCRRAMRRGIIISFKKVSRKTGVSVAFALLIALYRKLSPNTDFSNRHRTRY